VLPYRGPRHPRAVEAVARVAVWPDEAYRRYFQRMLDTPELRPGVPAGVDLIEEAHAMAGKSRYVLWRQRFPLDPPAPGSVRTGCTRRALRDACGHGLLRSRCAAQSR
jgi:hypothetical protein